MKGPNRWFKRPGVLVVGAIALIAAHATILRYVLAHAALSAAVVSGVIILVVIKHLGLLGSLVALFRRQSRH
jgi:hypothetical protein